MPKKVLIPLPPAMLEQIDFIAQVEHRTRSDLIRESLRCYIDGFRRKQRVMSPLEVTEDFSPPVVQPMQAAPVS
jgi:metal-responsive CopG/Arc/MetJ family transcriptional regulator